MSNRFGLSKAGPRNRDDQRAELLLGALACVVLALIAGMIIFVFQKAWPSFENNGLDWFSPWAGGSVDEQLSNIFQSPSDPASYVYTMHAWPLIYATALITLCSVILATVISVLSAVFIVEFAPEAIRRVLEPVVRLLAAVPSVIYGLIGILVIAPWVNDTFITQDAKNSVAGVITLSGPSIGVGIMILTVMITPIMIAIVVDALKGVPRDWKDGAVALGVNRFRGMWTVSVRAARPAIVAAAVLATARALGEAIMLSMVTGSIAHAPNPIDGGIFFLEPAKTLAATIVESGEGLSVPPFQQTIYAFAAVLLVSAAFLSFSGWYIRRILRRYTLSPI